jgi:glycosyltransferase involved in cell wall biosynthesis
MNKYALNIPLDQYPKVSVLTPTYNRGKFIPYLIKCFQTQDYPQEKMEWIIIDDGSEPVGHLFENVPNAKYYFFDEKQNICWKRNKCNELASGDIMVCMDDDDYYPPTRVSSAVKALYNTNYQLAGASEIYMYYSDIQEIYKLGPYGDKHCTNGTMAYTKEYADSHQYEEYVTHAEEKSFLDDYENPCAQINAKDVMLVMSHTMNTFDKRKMRNGNNKFVSRSKLKIEDFIKDRELLEFYRTA